MRPLILQPVTLVWAVLVLATCVAWWSASHAAVPSFEATAIVMIIAAVKARLVILHFMDLKEAPRSWRFLFEGWVVLTTCVILGGYWYALDTADPRESVTGRQPQSIALAGEESCFGLCWPVVSGGGSWYRGRVRAGGGEHSVHRDLQTEIHRFLDYRPRSCVTFTRWEANR
jgi:heme/copper-type cytochrome/quinol oxidase subunit 4